MGLSFTESDLYTTGEQYDGGNSSVTGLGVGRMTEHRIIDRRMTEHGLADRRMNEHRMTNRRMTEHTVE
jgi:hypothetical protein